MIMAKMIMKRTPTKKPKIYFSFGKIELILQDFLPHIKMEKIPVDEEEIVVSDDEDDTDFIDYDPSNCNCDLCYYSREICQYIQDEKDREEEEEENEEENE